MLLLREVSANTTDGHAVKKQPETAQMFGRGAGASIRSQFIVCNDSLSIVRGSFCLSAALALIVALYPGPTNKYRSVLEEGRAEQETMETQRLSL